MVCDREMMVRPLGQTSIFSVARVSLVRDGRRGQTQSVGRFLLELRNRCLSREMPAEICGEK